MPSIRAANEADMDDLVRIGHAFYAYNPYRHSCELDDSSLQLTLRELMRNHVLLVLVDRGKVVGTAGAFIAPLYWNHSKRQAVEFFWWIDPEYRKGKNGKALFECLELACKARGADYMTMIALEDSAPERTGKLYERAGYHKIENAYMKVFS